MTDPAEVSRRKALGALGPTGVAFGDAGLHTGVCVNNTGSVNGTIVTTRTISSVFDSDWRQVPAGVPRRTIKQLDRSLTNRDDTFKTTQ